MYYTLDNQHNPIPAEMTDFKEFFSDIDRYRVDRTVIGNVEISTVFLGIDHGFSDDGPPVLFETMIFGGRLDGYQGRSCTWDKAVAMHAEAVKRVEAP
jgi:hypothetical protein